MIEADKQLVGKYNLGFEYSEAYIDFETCFENQESINTYLMMFLYQMLNKKKKCYLITQNLNKALEFLEKNKIMKEIFENIYEVSRTQIAQYIGDFSIFLSNDDKLKNELRNKKDIKCFSNNIIEALIDWRA